MSQDELIPDFGEDNKVERIIFEEIQNDPTNYSKYPTD